MCGGTDTTFSCGLCLEPLSTGNFKCPSDDSMVPMISDFDEVTTSHVSSSSSGRRVGRADRTRGPGDRVAQVRKN